MTLLLEQDLRTGNVRIDEDHQRLVDHISGLLAAVDRGQRDLIETALEAFARRVVNHFDFEASLMATVPYPQAAEHKEAHASYLMDLRKFQTELRRNGVTEPFRMWARGRLVSWFQLHIRAHDVALARALGSSTRARAATR